MLTRLLTLIQEGGLRTTGELAAAMGLSHELVVAMIDDLSRRGRLLPTTVSCTPRCGSCPLKGTCGTISGEAGRLFALLPGRAPGDRLQETGDKPAG